MTSRRINLNVPDLPDPDRCAWLEANGIDPFTTPAAQEVLVEDGKLTFVQFVTDENGVKKLSGDHQGYEKVLRTIPLIAAPENYNL